MLWAIIKALLFKRQYFWKLATLILAGDALLTLLIIHFVPYTEIDFKTYIVQADKVQKGQRDYSLIYGPSGPLVYPAGHVMIHRGLSFVLNATSFRTVQYIYGALYLASMLISCMIYHRAKTVPNWVLLLLPLSKRLHSIYVLRLFNDCWSSTIAMLSIYVFSFAGNELMACFLFSFALSIKMNILLYMPGLLVVFLKSLGVIESFVHLGIIVLFQIWLAMPFMMSHPRAYLSNAFDLSRQFLYKWTVNWRFVPEEVFLSKQFAFSLLVGHLTALALFAFLRWFKNDGGLFETVKRGFIRPLQRASWDLPSGDEIITILFTSNLIGITFARSLHYQFYSWYAQQLPLLLWRTRYPLPVKLCILLGIEYSWNVFPSTNWSSAILDVSHLLILIGLWSGYATGTKGRKVSFNDKVHEVEDDTNVSTSSMEWEPE